MRFVVAAAVTVVEADGIDAVLVVELAVLVVELAAADAALVVGIAVAAAAGVSAVVLLAAEPGIDVDVASPWTRVAAVCCWWR